MEYLKENRFLLFLFYLLSILGPMYVAVIVALMVEKFAAGVSHTDKK